MRRIGYHRHEPEDAIRNWRAEEYEVVDEDQVPGLIDNHFALTFPDGFYSKYGQSGWFEYRRRLDKMGYSNETARWQALSSNSP